MEGFVRVLAVTVTAVIATAILKRMGGEFAAVLALCCVCLLGTFAVRTAAPVVEVIERLETLSGLSPAVLGPVLKAALVGILTGIASAVCADGGQNGMAKAVELCGTVMALCLAAPLISAVLELLESLMEK